MNKEETQRKLLNAIAAIKREQLQKRRKQLQDNLEDFQKEYRKASEGAKRSKKLMLESEKAGEAREADRHRQAYEVCIKYKTQLGHIIDGYKARLSGNVYFTKNGEPGKRFKEYPKD